MLGVLINAAAVVLGGIIGLLCKKAIPDKLAKAIMTGLGLCVLYLGIKGSLSGQNTLLAIISVVLGAVIGTLLDIDRRFNQLGQRVGNLSKKKENAGSLAEGFVSASLLFCVGAMTIVGSLNAGLGNDNSMLYTKSLLDFVSAIVFASSLGAGVLLASVTVLAVQGVIVLLSSALQSVLTAAAIAEITCTGSLLILALGLNMLGISRIKVANYLPAIVIAPILCHFFA